MHLRVGLLVLVREFWKRADRDEHNRRKTVLPLRALENAETANGAAINAMLGISLMTTHLVTRVVDEL